MNEGGSTLSKEKDLIMIMRRSGGSPSNAKKSLPSISSGSHNSAKGRPRRLLRRNKVDPFIGVPRLLLVVSVTVVLVFVVTTLSSMRVIENEEESASRYFRIQHQLRRAMSKVHSVQKSSYPQQNHRNENVFPPVSFLKESRELPPLSPELHVPMIDMRELNKQLPFDNPDGGVWKQGWDLKPRKVDSKHPLNVIVVPVRT